MTGIGLLIALCRCGLDSIRPFGRILDIVDKDCIPADSFDGYATHQCLRSDGGDAVYEPPVVDACLLIEEIR